MTISMAHLRTLVAVVAVLIAGGCKDSSGPGGSGGCGGGDAGVCGAGGGGQGASGTGGANTGGANTGGTNTGGSPGTCPPAEGSCVETESKPLCEEVAGFAHTSTFASDCAANGGTYSAGPCDASGYNYGCRLSFPGGCATSYIDYADPDQLQGAVAACLYAGGTVLKP